MSTRPRLNNLAAPGAVALLLLASAACAPTSSLQTRYLADNAPRADGLLLVARMPEPAQRGQWERACLDA
ncbi:MAG: hypothetical protein ACPG43_13020, partial [Alcanivoracaceae bacterium]